METDPWRVEPDARLAFHRRMQHVALALGGSCVVVGVVAPLLLIHLAILSLVAAIGVVFAVDMGLRARRGLARPEALVLRLDAAGRITVCYEGHDPHVVAQPVGVGQAFADHVQLVAGQSGQRLYQVEIPVPPERRRALLAWLERGAVRPQPRGSVARHFAWGLTVVPALVFAGYLVYRVVVLALLAGGLAAVMALPTELGLGVLSILVLLGLGLWLRRLLSP